MHKNITTIEGIIYSLQNRYNMIGKIINGYRITQEIGKGGMAIVYKGENNNSLVKFRAFKVVRPDKGENNFLLYNRFLKEIEITNKLREQDNIVKVEAVHQLNNTTVLEMEYLDGLNLDQYIKQKATSGIKDQNELKKICFKILEALQYAHGKGVLHLDIKPNNIFRTYSGRVKLLDFGIAKVVGEKANIIEGAETLITITETGESTFKGALAFSSPEQQAGATLSPASDIFSFGKTLHYIATGTSDMNTECHLEPFAFIIDKCTQQKVKNRFESSQEIINYLDNPAHQLPNEVKCINQNCNKVMDKKFKFCPYCRIEQIEQSKFKDCPECKIMDNSLDSRYCYNCGFDLENKNLPSAKKKTCERHGGIYNHKDNYCNECGCTLTFLQKST